ncbi:U3 small nucleolar RNA-associated protein 18 homolog [Tubulanus polymorphus]|uniref:U3 small nucleolar RNA-associated protein 18 homolog n=1 Tax=Tubulanus polymorphus TaxID=672921 RepID=UPI003DA5A19F
MDVSKRKWSEKSTGMNKYRKEENSRNPYVNPVVEKGIRQINLQLIQDDEEKNGHLEDLVFGDSNDLVERLEEAEEDESSNRLEGLGVIDRKPAWDDDDDDKAVFSVNVQKSKIYSEVRKPNEEILPVSTYKKRLKQRFEKVTGGTPSWAEFKTTADENIEEDSGTVNNYLEKDVSLPSHTLDYNQHNSFGFTAKQHRPLESVEFHPALHIRLIAGEAGFELLQGVSYESLKKLRIEAFPIKTARFTKCGQQVILGSIRQKTFYSYDMMADKLLTIPRIKGIMDSCSSMGRFVVSPDGKFIAFHGTYGHIHLISAKSKELIDSFKMNGQIDAITFNPSGDRMFSHGDDGEVYVWDVNNRSCVHKFCDDGCVKGTSLAVSSNQQYLACGSSSGIVNVYNYEACQTQSSPKPLRIIGNLTTSCDFMKFNSTCELLAIGSSSTVKAIKLIHFPTMTAFANFPDKPINDRHRTEFSLAARKYVPTCVDFSPNSGFLAVTTKKGLGESYRLRHYENY